LNKDRIINRYPNIKELGRKDVFERMMSVGSDISPETFDFVPPSFIFPRDQAKFEAYQKKHKNAVFIAKPDSGCQGDGIVLFNSLKQLPVYKDVGEMVVQRYLDDPFLVDGIKFDLRVYVMVTGINEGNIHAFIADEGLARFCT